MSSIVDDIWWWFNTVCESSISTIAHALSLSMIVQFHRLYQRCFHLIFGWLNIIHINIEYVFHAWIKTDQYPTSIYAFKLCVLISIIDEEWGRCVFVLSRSLAVYQHMVYLRIEFRTITWIWTLHSAVSVYIYEQGPPNSIDHWLTLTI